MFGIWCSVVVVFGFGICLRGFHFEFVWFTLWCVRGLLCGGLLFVVVCVLGLVLIA